jgi:ubiquinone/menaquinone biosynthesis C-methylase UbiE
MYENGSLSKATGDKTLRPGGFDLTERLLTLCELSADSQIVDVGCGTGGTVEYLLDAGFAHAIGIDRSELLLQTGICRRPSLSLACAWSKSLPIASGQVDAVFSECSLSAMFDLDGSLTEFRRILRSGGQLALSDIYARNAEGLPALHALPLSCGLRKAMTREQLTENLQAHGFETIVWEDHSEMLKQLIGQMIFAHGSMREFWSRSEPEADPMEHQAAVSKAKLGYHLLVARKT